GHRRSSPHGPPPATGIPGIRDEGGTTRRWAARELPDGASRDRRELPDGASRNCRELPARRAEEPVRKVTLGVPAMSCRRPGRTRAITSFGLIGAAAAGDQAAAARARPGAAARTARPRGPLGGQPSAFSLALPLRISAAVGLLSRRNWAQRTASSISPIAWAARWRAYRQRRNPRFGSCSHGIGPCPFHPARRSWSSPRW